MEKFVLRKTENGWTITLIKEKGINKGETVIATFCGGSVGLHLALNAVKSAANTFMIYDIEIYE